MEPMISTAMEIFPTEDQSHTDIDRIDGVVGSPTKSNSGQSRSSTTGSDSQDEDNLLSSDEPVRARVFALADDGAWEDLATGVFFLESDIVSIKGNTALIFLD